MNGSDPVSGSEDVGTNESNDLRSNVLIEIDDGGSDSDLSLSDLNESDLESDEDNGSGTDEALNGFIAMIDSDVEDDTDSDTEDEVHLSEEALLEREKKLFSEISIQVKEYVSENNDFVFTGQLVPKQKYYVYASETAYLTIGGRSSNEMCPEVDNSDGVHFLSGCKMGLHRYLQRTYYVQKPGRDYVIVQFPFVKSSLNPNAHTGMAKRQFYYETTLVQLPPGGLTCAAFGVAKIRYWNSNGMVGWYHNSLGYHSDNGFVYNGRSNVDEDDEEEVKMLFFEKYGQGDTIGVGMDIFSLSKWKTLDEMMTGFRKMYGTVYVHRALRETLKVRGKMEISHELLDPENKQVGIVYFTKNGKRNKVNYIRMNASVFFPTLTVYCKTNETIFTINNGSDTRKKPFCMAEFNVHPYPKLMSKNYWDCIVYCTDEL